MQPRTDFSTDLELLPGLCRVGQQIGRTPVHRVGDLFSKKDVQIYAKKEWAQFSGSVKARPAYHIIRSAVENGELHRGRILLDATSGNTGIAYAAIGRELGIRVTLCLPENASPERKTILRALGAEIVFTSRFGGSDEAQLVARELAAERPDLYFYADQYANEHNWQAHFQHTGVEILEAFPAVTHFVAGMGTTGTFTGTGRRLKAFNPAIQLIALQPDAALHGLEGWKHLETAAVPAIYDATLADATLEIDTAEAYEILLAAWRHEGLRLSPSSAANLAGAIRVAEKLDSGVVFTVFPDNSDKYAAITKQFT